MKTSKWFLLLLLLTPLFGSLGCRKDEECVEGEYTAKCKPPVSYYDNRITEGKRYLSMFDGERARQVFRQVNDDYVKFNGKPYCKAAYGAMLANSQVFVSGLNGLALRLLTNLSGGTAAAPYSPAAAKPNDFGVLLENGWSTFEPVLREMSYYARTVTSIPDCNFSIGLNEQDEKMSETQEENPYQFVINIGGPGGAFSPQDFADKTKIKNAPVAQLIFKTRFDGAEARLVDAVSRALLGSADFVLAHDYSMVVDLYKIAYQLGLDLDCVRTNILNCDFEQGPRTYSDGKASVTNGSAVVAGVNTKWKSEADIQPGEVFKIGGATYTVYSVSSDTSLQLTAPYSGSSGTYSYSSTSTHEWFDYIVSRILGWSFLFEDNANLLGRSETRWERRFNAVDNEFAGAFYPMRTFFDSLIARNLSLVQKSASSQQLDEYVIIYKDGNENGQMDSFDELGFNFTEIKLSPEWVIEHTNLEATPEGVDRANEMRAQFNAIEDAINGGKNVLKGFQPSEGAVEEVKTFVERAHNSFAAVDNPDSPHERIPINSFNTVMTEFFLGLILDEGTPNFMEFDVTLYFLNGRPLRDYVPYWKVTDNGTFSEFVVDSDDYMAKYIGPQNPTYTYGQMVSVAADKFVQSVAWEADLSTPALERGVFLTGFDGGVRGNVAALNVARDCINGGNLYSTVAGTNGGTREQSWPVAYLAMPDPTLNGMVWIDLDAWATTYGAGNGAACPSDPSGINEATNYSLTKGMWMFVDFLVDHFQLVQLLGGL